MVYKIVLFGIAIMPLSLWRQNDFIKEIIFDNSFTSQLVNLQLREDGNFTVFLSLPSSTGVTQLNFNESGTFIDGIQANFLGEPWRTSELRGNYLVTDEHIIYNMFRAGSAEVSKTAIYIYDIQNSSYSIKQLSNIYLRKESFTLSLDQDKLLTSQHMSPLGENGREFVGLSLIDLSTYESE